jgi:hypothetical protein
MYPEALGNIAEVSIGLAGFSAIVAVFIQQSRRLTPVDRFRTISLLLLALTPAFLSFLCIGLVSVVGDIELASRISAGVLAIWMAGLLLFLYRSKRQMPSEHERALNQTIFAFMYATAIIVIVAMTIAAAFDTRYAYATFYFGLVVVLIMAVVQFIRILIGERVQDDA